MKYKNCFWLFMIVSLSLTSCSSSNAKMKSNIQKVTVYKTSFNINNPVSISKTEIKKMKPYRINEVDELTFISELLEGLEPSEDENFIEDIYLLAVVEFSNGKKFELLYNKVQLNYKGKNYKPSILLFDKLSSLQPDAFNTYDLGIDKEHN